jgi:sec-independent protein translocase protein TatA
MVGSVRLPLALVGPIGAWEIVLILLIVVFLFGARRIPDIARGLGEGIRNFRSAVKGQDTDPDARGDRTDRLESGAKRDRRDD